VITGSVGATLTLQSAASALVDVQAGTHEINLPLILASNTTFQTDAGTASLVISDPVTVNSGVHLTTAGTGTVTYLSTVTLQSGATMNIASSTHASGLSLAATASASIDTTSGARTVLQLDSLSIASSGTLDVKNNEVVIHNGNLSTITSEVAAGYAGGTWSGNGITSSTAQADPTHVHAVGVEQIGTDVKVAYTYYGDANLSGAVDGSDYSLIDSSYLNERTSHTSISGWQNGDFNYDGVVNGSDYTLIDNAFNSQGPALSAAELASSTAEISGTSVPEPIGLASLAICGLGLFGRRRRRN
jgi:hypothetical protein